MVLLAETKTGGYTLQKSFMCIDISKYLYIYKLQKRVKREDRLQRMDDKKVFVNFSVSAPNIRRK